MFKWVLFILGLLVISLALSLVNSFLIFNNHLFYSVLFFASYGVFFLFMNRIVLTKFSQKMQLGLFSVFLVLLAAEYILFAIL